MPLFGDVAYCISDSVPERTRREIGSILDANGATEVALHRATIVVSDTSEFEGAILLRKDVPCVTPYWVERSMELGIRQDPKYFSADMEMIFSGIVATSAGIPPGDKEVIIAGIKESGGQWREGLTRDVTHLFVTNTSSQKYETAMHFREAAHITILLPQWFDQCWSMQMRLPHKVFEFPDPPYMRKDHDEAAYKAQMLVNKEPKDKAAMFRSLRVDVASPTPAASSAALPRNVWQARAILLSSSLALDVKRRESVEERIRHNGGKVVTVADEEDETAAVGRAAVLVTRFRAGPAYARALAEDKIIGTLSWLFYVERSGVVSSPRDKLLHYPVRNRPVEGFEHHLITVTNYQGDQREYLKKLIAIMGATFTPTMSGHNTIVIAAYKGGNKTEKADEWSVPVVTHKWLEDCFVEWRNLTPAQRKYLDYAPGVNYGTVLGDRGVGRVGLEEDPELTPEKDASVLRNGETSVKEDVKKAGEEMRLETKCGSGTQGFSGTASNTRDAQEVEEVEDALNVEGIEYVDRVLSRGDLDKQPEPRQVLTPVKVGPPRGAKKTPARAESTTKSTPKSKEKEDVPSPLRKEKAKDHSEDDESATAPLRKSKSQPRPRMVNKDKDHAPVTSNPNPESKLVIGKRSTKVAFDTDYDDDEQPTFVKKRLLQKPSSVRMDGNVVENKPTQKPTTKLILGKELRRKVTNINSDEEVEVPEVVDDTPPRVVGKSTPKMYQSKVKAKARVQGPASDPESEESVQELPTERSRGKHQFAHASRPSPTRRVSVELPDPRSILRSVKTRVRTPERKDSAAEESSPIKSSPVTRTMSIRATANEAPSVGTPKRNRPAARHGSDAPRSSSPVAKNAKTVSEESRSTSTPPPIKRKPSRRSAAAAAAQKLRNEVMPDVMNYEKEVKRRVPVGVRKRKASSSLGLENDEDEESGSGGGGREKKKKVSSNEKMKERGARGDVEDESNGPASKFVTHAGSNKRSIPTDEEDELDLGKRNSRRKKARVDISSDDGDVSGDETVPRCSSFDPKKIRVLTTKVEVREEVSKDLIKLGVKFTDKPNQCTHLVASSYARTEKFLCALSNAPFVLNVSWLLESSAKKMILEESDFLLKDAAMEKKHSFKLSEALERARELKRKKRKLFQGHFFYFTPNVSVDFNLVKKVIQTNGGECIQQKPTVRNLSQTRHIVSSSEDEKVWRPLATQGFPIYSKELILMAACAQFVDWDDLSKRVERSF